MDARRSTRDSGLFDAESLRAMAVAYCIDYQDLRSQLEATDMLVQAFDEAVGREGRLIRGQHLARGLLGGLLRRAALAVGSRFSGIRSRLQRLFLQPAFRHYDEQQRQGCRQLLAVQRGPLLVALHRLTHRRAPADPVENARQKLQAVARDPTTWSQQLLVLRTVQTLTVLDLQTYCDLVYHLGEYAELSLRSNGVTPA